MQVIAKFLTPFIDLIGPIDVLILLSLLAWTLIALAVAVIIIFARCALLEAIDAYKKWQARREADAVREADALMGADATPSLMFSTGNADDGGISSMFFAICLNGGVASVVEDSFYDVKCSHPCPEHPECQLAN